MIANPTPATPLSSSPAARPSPLCQTTGVSSAVTHNAAMLSAVSAEFVPPRWLRNAHLQTFWPTLLRRNPGIQAERIAIATPDDDELEADWWRGADPGNRLIVLSHGLEGSSRSKYAIGLAQAARASGWDVLAWNYRGCGFRMNRAFRLYHSGETRDLATVIKWGAERYGRIALAGFSVGGNVTLRYLGEAPDSVHPSVERAIAFSVPCDLGASARQLARPPNRIYLVRFMRELKRKIVLKAAQYPGRLDLSRLREARDFVTFDDYFTAPMFGWGGADEYYANASSAPVIGAIRVPTLVVTALDDPFLTPACLPRATATVRVELPQFGGHVGFVDFRDPAGRYWSERRALAWLEEPAHSAQEALGAR